MDDFPSDNLDLRSRPWRCFTNFQGAPWDLPMKQRDFSPVLDVYNSLNPWRKIEKLRELNAIYEPLVDI